MERQYISDDDMRALKPVLGQGIYANDVTTDANGKKVENPPYYPSTFTDPDFKQTKEYSLNVARVMWWNNWQSNGNGYGNQRRSKILECRNWSNGRFEVESFLGGKKPPQDVKANPIMKNIDFDPVTPLSKIRDEVVGRMEEMDFDVIATTLNPMAAAQKENARLNEIALHRINKSGFTDKINAKAGQKVMPKTNLAFEPGDEEEINLLYQLGGFKQVAELEIELANRVVMNDSAFSETKKCMLEDCFDGGEMGTDIIYDKDGRVKIKYVDPANATIPDFRGHYLNNPNRICYIELESVHKVLMAAESQFSDSEMKEICTMFENKFGNPVWNAANQNTSQYANSDVTGQFYFLYNWMVPVMYMRWEELDFYDTIEYENKNGFKVKTFKSKKSKDNKEMGVEEYLQTLPNDSIWSPAPEQRTADGTIIKKIGGNDVRVRRVQFHRYYQCSWLINTNFLFDYGRVPIQARDPYNPRYSQCPTKYYRVAHQSMAERIIPYARKNYMNEKKIQAGIARLRVPGYAINIKGIESISLGGGQKLSVKHIFEILNETGDYLYVDEAQGDILGQTKNKEHIKPLAMPYLKEWFESIMMLIDHNTREVAKMTGLIDDSAPNPNMPVGVAEISQQSSSISLSQISSGFLTICEKIALDVSERVRQVVILTGNYSGYADAMGQGLLTSVNVSPAVIPHRMGIRVKARPTAKQKEEFKQAVMQAFSNMASVEQGGLWVTDAMEIIQEVDNGVDFKILRIVMADRIKKKLADLQKQKMDAINQQLQGNAQQAQQTQQAELTELQMETKMKLILINAQRDADIAVAQATTQFKGSSDIVKDSHRGNLKIQEMQVKAGLGV